MTEPEATRRRRPNELSRRSLLRGGLLGGVGLAAAALLGCTEDEDPAPQPVVSAGPDPTPSLSPVPTTEPEPRPVIPYKRTPDVTPLPSPDYWDDLGALIWDMKLPYPYQWPEPRLPPAPGGTLRIGSTIDFDSMDPLHSNDGGSVTFPNMVYNRLLGMVSGPRKDPFAIELEQELAWAWERSPDGVTLTFHLHDVHWQDVPPLQGRQLVADDVRFAFERYRQGDGPQRAHWENVGAIEAPHPLTLTVDMATVTADFLVPLAGRHHPIFPRELVDRESIHTRAVGTGPMILEEAEAGSHVSFLRNQDYFERSVILDGVRFEFVPDHTERFELLRKSEIDYAFAAIARQQDLEDLVAWNPDVQINFGAVEHGGMPLGLNLSDPAFADERVRQAITLAIEPYLMAYRVYGGLAQVLPLHPWFFVRDATPRPEVMELGPWFDRHDPEEATRLLAAAGAEDLSFTSPYHDGVNAALDNITEMVAEQLAAVGITMHAQRVDQSDFDRIWTSGDLPEASTSAFAPQGFDADHFFYHLVHSQSPKNLWNLDDPQVDVWAEAQRAELDPDARREIHRTMWDYFLEKMYWPPLPSPLRFEVSQWWVRGLRFGGILDTNSSYYDWGDQIAGVWIDDPEGWRR